ITHDSVSSFKGLGIALQNVSKRIKLYYAEHNLTDLHLNSELGQGTKVTFEIPVEGEWFNGC
ncbi:MAG: sensor histidine kinase, partial [Bacillus sp. (in: firmicutes)]